jgi:tight adherence protein C
VIRLVVAAGLLVWAGSALILSQWSRLSRPTLAERLRPFHPGGADVAGAGSPGSVSSLAGVLSPLARDAGDWLAALLGAADGAERRLARIHSPVTAGTYRLRQGAASAGVAVAGGVVAALSSAPVPLAVLLVVGAPALVFLVVEQRLAHRSQRWQRTTSEELPVVAEQMAMLLNAGFSVGAAIHRLSTRGDGCVARDLEGVVNRVQQGLSESAALHEWSSSVDVVGVHRLVAVLTLHSEAADLGRLVSDEARATRRELQRRTLEQIERRAQQVWIPVTVATLVPGAILLAVPFLAALHAFSTA